MSNIDDKLFDLTSEELKNKDFKLNNDVLSYPSIIYFPSNNNSIIKNNNENNNNCKNKYIYILIITILSICLIVIIVIYLLEINCINNCIKKIKSKN